MNQNTHPLLTHLIATAKAMGGECHTIEVPAGGFSAPALEKMLNDILLGKPPKEPSEGTKKAMAEARKAAFPPIDPHALDEAMAEHPKAREARQNAEIKRAQRNTMKEQVDLALKNGVVFHTIEGTTFACIREIDVLRIATTLRHPRDNNDPLLAKDLALHRLISGQYMDLRVPKHFKSVSTFLNFTFQGWPCHRKKKTSAQACLIFSNTSPAMTRPACAQRSASSPMKIQSSPVPVPGTCTCARCSADLM